MSLRMCVDPGHGGEEPGAVFNGYKEKDLNLKVASLLKRELERCGIEVVMTRASDITMSLSARAKIAKENKCTALISVHFNAYNEKARGTEVIYSFKKECLESSKWIAECILNEAVKLGTIKRGIWTKESNKYSGRNYYGILRGIEPLPGVIAEGLFLDNLEDIKFLKDTEFLKNLAIAYARGICTAYGITYVQNSQVAESASPFSDWGNVSSYAKEGVQFMKDAGLMLGDTSGKFNPQGTLTRQDFAVVMSKIIKKYNLKG